MKKRTPLLFTLNALAYLTCTFAFALIWHVSLFKQQYDTLGWRSPDSTAVGLGFAAVALQALLLSFVFQQIQRSRRFQLHLAAFVSVAFLYLWSSHVLGDAAKLPLTSKFGFITLETAYLIGQFLIYGAALWVIHRLFDPEVKESARTPASSPRVS